MTLLDGISKMILPPTPFQPTSGWVPPALSTAATAPPDTMTAAVAAPAVAKSAPKTALSTMNLIPEPQEWQTRAWAYYRVCGEARQAVNWLASGLSRCHLFVGEVQPEGKGDPKPVDTPGLAGEILAELYDGQVGQRDMLARLGVHLLVPGESWLIGYPSAPEPGAPATEQTSDGENSRTTWSVLSRKEWSTDAPDGDQIRLKLPEDPRRDLAGWVTFKGEDVAAVPIYEPDPEDGCKATSSFEAALGVLDEIDGLSRRVGADINSRLAGAGIAAICESATMASPGQSEGLNPINGDPIIAAILRAASTAIGDPDSPAAVVPIFLKVPDEAFAGEGPIKHVDFSTPFDEQIPKLREGARRTLAGSLDVPNAVVEGVQDLNHWTAWQVGEDAVVSHIGPLLSLICTAITRKILWPALRAAGESDVEKRVIWWDATALILRPDQTTEALAAHSQGAIGNKTLCRVLGLPEDEALPDKKPEEEQDPNVEPGGEPALEGGQAKPSDRPEAPVDKGGRTPGARPPRQAAPAPA